jgi:alkyl hydroperoxide reductase subunit D
MTSLDAIRDAIPDFARDLRLNLGSVLAPTGAPGLNEKQIWAVAVASAIASRNPELTRGIEALATAHLDEAYLNAARAAAAVMGMNNVYYRFLHLVEDAEYQTMPARLRMNVIGNPGIDKLDFELASLAVSAVNGCGMCIVAHEKQLRKHDVSREAIQSAVRIAATIHAVAGVLEYAASQPAATDVAAAAA